jgi:hypothetical protein
MLSKAGDFNFTTFILLNSIGDSSAGIRVVCGVGGQGSITGRGKEIFLYTTASRPALGPTLLSIQWVLGIIFPGVKRPGREADHSPPFSAEVKNVGALLPLPHVFMA